MFTFLIFVVVSFVATLVAFGQSKRIKKLEKQIEDLKLIEEVHEASLQEIDELEDNKKNLEEANASLEEANTSLEEAASEALRALEEQHRLTIMAARLGSHPSFGETKMLLEAGFFEPKTIVVVSIDSQIAPQRMSVQKLLAALAVKEQKDEWLVDILMSA